MAFEWEKTPYMLNANGLSTHTDTVRRNKRRIKITEHYVPVCAFDFETLDFIEQLTAETDELFRLGSVVTYAQHAYGASLGYSIAKIERPIEALDAMVDIARRFKSKKCISYAHNLDYDFRFIEWALENGGSEWYNFKYEIIANGARLMRVTLLATEKTSGQQYTIELRDSINITVASLDKSARSLLGYGKSGHYTDSDDDLWEYCFSDTILVLQVLEAIADLLGKQVNKLKLTIPSEAAAATRKEYRKTTGKKFIGDDTETNDYHREAYFGGRIYIREGLRPSDVNDVVSLDITSSYPHQMQNLLLAAGRKHERLPIVNGMIDLNAIGTCKIRVRGYKPKLPIIPIRGAVIEENESGVLIKSPVYPRGDFNAHITIIELQYLVNHQLDSLDSIEVLDAVGYSSATAERQFSGFISKFYQIKLDGDAMNSVEPGSGDAKRTFGKLILNSAYGKFAERLEKSDPIYSEGASPEDFGDREYTNENVSVVIAAYITAMGRLQLYDMIEYYGAENVLYCDTDSVKILKTAYESMPKHPAINDELGGWKNEGVYSEFSVIAPKIYCGIHDGKPELKCKGLSMWKGSAADAERLGLVGKPLLHGEVFNGNTNEKIANTFDAVTNALRCGELVSVISYPAPTRLKTFLNTREFVYRPKKSFTTPSNVTGYTYNNVDGYRLHTVHM